MRSECEVFDDILTDISFKLPGHQLVDFRNEDCHFGNELDKSLWNENDSVVLSKRGTLANDVSDLRCNLRQSLVFGFDLFAYEDEVDASAEGTLQGDVRSRPTHESNEVIVLFGRNSVRAKVADSFRVDLCGSVETKGDRNVLVLQVTIDGLGAANDAALGLVLSKVLGQQASIGVGVVATDDNEAIKVKGLSVLERILELLRLLNFVSAGT